MKKITDIDLLMLHLDECNDKELQDQILSSDEHCAKLQSLEKDMNAINNHLSEFESDTDYGHELWNKISDKLEPQVQESKGSLFLKSLFQPRFSMAGIAAIFVFSFAFFMLGKQQSVSHDNSQMAEMLLAQNIQLHLTQADVFLTQLNNMPEQAQSAMMVNTAQNLLLTNRIFKTALRDSQNTQTQQLLTELEQVLTEISNNTQPKQQLYEFTNQQLLYKVKTFNKKIENDNTLI